MRSLAGWLLMAMAAAGAAGCVAPAMIATAGFGALQTGTEAFIRGELEAAVVNPMDQVYLSSRSALEELGFEVTNSKLREDDAFIRSKEYNDRKIVVELVKKSEHVTKIVIRVGLFGDQAISRLILSHIQEKLGPAQVQAAGPVP